MPPPEAAVAHHTSQKALIAGIITRIRKQWANLDPSNLDHSWRAGRIGTQIFATVAIGQQTAAGLADPYLDAVLAEQAISARSTAKVVPSTFAGIASDGRSLDTLLYESVIAVKSTMQSTTALYQPGDIVRSMAAGESRLIRIAATQIADAGRTAVGTAVISRPDVGGYTRMLNPPSCARCAVLAGRFYRWNTGFARHPLCDCVHIPTIENHAGDLTTDPQVYFDSLSPEDQAKYFTVAGARAINDGADLGQVVNVRRKGAMYQANGQDYTTESTTKRGSAAGLQRPMPETIYANATDRTAALHDLRNYGYLA